jgi:hypothetical protein
MAANNAQPVTRLEYNGVTLNNVTTRTFHQEVVYDPSGTDLMYTRFEIEVECYIHAHEDRRLHLDVVGPWVSPQKSSASNATDLEVEIRKALTQPRKPLKYTNHGKVLVECVPSEKNSVHNANRDVNNGPRPLRFDITRVGGDQVYRVVFAVECAKLECVKGASSSGLPDVLSNRWSIAEEMDEQWYVTRIIRGRLRISQAVTLTPGHFRHVCLPRLENGFKRVRMAFLTEPNGLEAAYEVVDRQVAMSAPWPATSISGHHSYSTGNGRVSRAAGRPAQRRSRAAGDAGPAGDRQPDQHVQPQDGGRQRRVDVHGRRRVPDHDLVRRGDGGRGLRADSGDDRPGRPDLQGLEFLVRRAPQEARQPVEVPRLA